METGSTQDYIFMPIWKDGSPLFDSSLKISDDVGSPPSGDAGKKNDKVLDKESGASNKLNFSFENLNNEYPDDPKIPGLETIETYDDSEEEADFTNLKSSIHVSPTPTTRIYKNHPLKQSYTQEEGMDYDEFFSPVARIEAIRGDIRIQPLGFEDPDHLDKVYVDDIIFGSTKKELCVEFERLMKDKFQMRSMGELTFFLGLQVKQKKDGIFISQDKYVVEVLRKFNFLDVKSASTLVDTKKTLVKDADGDDVYVHLYRFMIGSL
nr:putative ribonuclease H-like domain-containing protein [Tanacetum cinerariifolium]